LQEALGDTSTGHLYHHLRELQAAGLVQQRRRGEYELVPHAMVPLLVVVAAALDLGADSVPSPPTAES
jgi:DNA-binding transcriptional ArsR family regulator